VQGLLCEYRLVDHNWNLVGTDNELERARNGYPTRRRLVPITMSVRGSRQQIANVDDKTYSSNEADILTLS
jgi:hypothetical protein